MSASEQLSFLGNEFGDGEQGDGEEFRENREWVPGGLVLLRFDRRGEIDLADEQHDDDQAEDGHSACRSGGQFTVCCVKNEMLSCRSVDREGWG